jgi:hypothetical protein
MIFQRAGTPAKRSPDNRRNGGQEGSAGRLSGLDAVRYMSVHSWKQPDLHGHSGTSSGQKHQPATPRKPRPRAISAGSGRCWVRTNVGEADGFTGSPLPPFPMVADLQILHSPPRENRVLSVWRP